MIKAVIFDYGNVIHKWDNDIFLRELVKLSGKDYDYIYDLIFNTGMHSRLEIGKISPSSFFEKIIKDLGIDINKNNFFDLFSRKLFQEIKTTFSLIKKLKKNYKVALLSNTNKIDFDYVMKKSELFPLFDSVTLSFEVGYKKPEKQIYLDALKKLNLKPDECVYIDDIKEYSDAASRLGLHGIHYTSHEKLVKELKKLKIKF
ncbi:MAG: HAD family phosphatase [Candidatus Nanoarchaeia archaeon]|nr:HAD family phosphatase [Candidatus Nanoarchaeia archaeon]